MSGILWINKPTNSTQCVVYGGAAEVLWMDLMFGERKVRLRDGQDAGDVIFGWVGVC